MALAPPPPILPFGRAIGCVLGCILDLDVFLSSREDVPPPDDFIFHQLLVEKVGKLHPTNECSSNHVVIALIHQVHLALEIIDIVFEVFSELHLNHEEMIDVLLELSSRSILVIESLLHLFEALE